MARLLAIDGERLFLSWTGAAWVMRLIGKRPVISVAWLPVGGRARRRPGSCNCDAVSVVVALIFNFRSHALHAVQIINILHARSIALNIIIEYMLGQILA